MLSEKQALRGIIEEDTKDDPGQEESQRSDRIAGPAGQSAVQGKGNPEARAQDNDKHEYW
jgi:hypothetical protein